MTQENTEIKRLPKIEGNKSEIKNIVMKHILGVWKDLSKNVQIEFLNEVLKNDPRKEN